MKEEQVLIVDYQNREVGSAPRSKMRQQGLIHRATYILVFNSKNELFAQKRTNTKDIYPGFFDVATGGVVAAGESYDQSARRELEEELGINNVPLMPLFEFFFQDGKMKVWGRAYFCLYDGEILLQKEEVQNGNFYPINEIIKLSEHDAFTPDSLYVLHRYLKKDF